MEVVDAGDGLAVKPDNHIALGESGCGAGARRLDGNNHDAAFHWQVVKADHAAVQRNVLPAHSDVAAPHFAVADQAPRDKRRRIDRDGEAQALRRQNHGRVNANHFAARIHQRPAGVPRVQRRVGLNDVVDQPAERARKERPKALTTPAVTVH